MKKHIIGLTIFAFIVGSFVSIRALFGYFTQTIPNVPTIESDNLPVFASDRKTSCFKPQRREKISYEVADSYYFVDEKKLVSTLKVSWNGYGVPPETLIITPKIFINDKKIASFGGGDSKRVTFGDRVRENYITVSADLSFNKNELKDNIYADFSVSSDPSAQFDFDSTLRKHQVVVVHGESSIIGR